MTTVKVETNVGNMGVVVLSIRTKEKHESHKKYTNMYRHIVSIYICMHISRAHAV